MNRPSGARSISSCFHVEPLERRMLLASAVDAALDELSHRPELSYVPPAQFFFKRGSALTKAATGAPLDLALKYLKTNAGALGLAASDLADPFVTDQYTDADTGTTHIYLRQKFNGLPVANADLNVTVLRDGRILSVAGAFVPGLGAQLGKTVSPKLIATQAVSRAAENLGLRLHNAPTLLNAGRDVQRTSVLRAGELSLDEIPAKLQYVPTPNGVELAWEIIARIPGGEHWYDTNVSASDGRLLFTADWTDDAADYSASFNVFPLPLLDPDDGPRQTVLNPWDLAASPFGWQDLNGTSGGDSSVTNGNNVSAQDDLDFNNTGGVRPSGGALNGDGTGSLNFNFPVDFNQAPLNSLSAATVNLYYWNNLLHDIHFKYGFTESAGNFQRVNYTGMGAGNDPVQADAQDGSGTNNANFSTPADGTSGRMQMYVWNYVTPNRDSSFDSGIMIHEYGHGVSNRLTGGPANSSALNTTQSAGMGEGWSDWWALMLTQTDGSPAARDAAYPIAPYSVGEAASGLGLRRFAYSFDKSIDPETFGLFNTSSEVHHTGELWCTALWDLNWILINKHGFNSNITTGYSPGAAGNILALKLVMDALKIQPANPTFMQARDAILSADTALTGGANQKEIWAAFARRGLGLSSSTAGASSRTMVEAFDIPAAVSAPIVTHSTPVENSRFAPLSSFVFNFNEAMNTASFSVASDVVSFTGVGGVDLKPQVSPVVVWGNGNKTLQISFTTQIADGAYTMTIGPNITSASGAELMDQDLDGNLGEAVDDRYVASVSLDARPGPDGSGYEAASYPFENIDLISGQAGVVTALDTGDDVTASIDLGANSFNFYGTTYTGAGKLFVSDNGLITFGTASSAFANKQLTIAPAQASISPLWDDWALDAGSNDKVLYKFDTPNNRLIIEWSQIVNRGDFTAQFNSTDATFQVILRLNTGSNAGDIIFNYPDLSVGTTNPAFANGGSATVGIKAPNNQGSNRLVLSLFSFPNNWLGDGKAVRLTTTSVSGKSYLDANGNGVQDGGEPPLSGQTLYIDANNNGLLDSGEISTITDGSGNYTLTSAPLGSVRVRQLTAAGYVQTTPSTGLVSLTSGQQLSGLDFGNFPVVYSGAGQYTLRLDPPQNRIQIFVDTPTTNPPTFTADKNIIPSLSFTGSSADNTLTIDMTNGDPLPSGGASFDALGQSSGDLLEFIGSSAADTISVTGSAVSTLLGAVTYSNIESILIDGAGGNDALSFTAPVLPALSFTGGSNDDTLTINSMPGNSPAVNLGPGNDTLIVNGSGFVMNSDGNAGGSNLTIQVNGAMHFAASQHLAALNIATSAIASMTAGGNKVIRTQELGLSGTANLDLNDSSLIVDYQMNSPLAMIQGALATGYASGAWNGNGISSTAAHDDPTGKSALGVAQSSDIFSTFPVIFAGESVGNSAVVVRKTIYGDADLNGMVNLQDFNRLAGNFGTGTRWSEGNFNYDSFVNLTDFNMLAGNFGLSASPQADKSDAEGDFRPIRDSLPDIVVVSPPR